MNVVILGAGESGIGAALLAKKNKYKVFVSEFGIIKDHYRNELIDNKIDFEESGHDFERLRLADVVIKSPGVPSRADVVVKLKSMKKRIISEIEFAASFSSGHILAITGSNGKTTTTSLLYHMLQEAELDVKVAGNIGQSMARQLADGDCKYWVLELSSFQLDDIDTFRANIAIILNITPDHLDRYNYDINKYAASKLQICKNQSVHDVLIYNSRDERILAAVQDQNILSQKVSIDPETLKNNVSSTDENLIFEMNLIGKHNVFNAACAVAAARIVGIDEPTIAKSLRSFEPIEHRLELVATIDGVKYINDSKATNVDSVFYALDAMQSKVIWIAGGTDKGNDYEAIRYLVESKVKALICLGIDNHKLISAFADSISIDETRSVTEAIQMAAHWANPGDTVLLSPACASFDLFKNYEDRGRKFKEAVWKLKE